MKFLFKKLFSSNSPLFTHININIQNIHHNNKIRSFGKMINISYTFALKTIHYESMHQREYSIEDYNDKLGAVYIREYFENLNDDERFLPYKHLISRGIGL